MAKSSEIREQMLAAASRLFRARGYEGVGVADLLAASGTPRGSLYFHFPGGKEQIAAETLLYTRDRVLARLDRFAEASAGLEDFIDRVFLGWADLMVQQDFNFGCPVAVISLETAQTIPALREAADLTFRAWTAKFAQIVRHRGVPEAHAQGLAEAMLSLVQGAIVLARASRSVTPFQNAGAAAKALAAAASSAQSAKTQPQA